MRGRLLDTVSLEVHMPTALERAIARFRRRPDDGGDTRGRISAAEFRAATEQRLRSLEREVAEVKGRINGLIFVVAGAVMTQVALRLVQ
jgi:hypothetical protein